MSRRQPSSLFSPSLDAVALCQRHEAQSASTLMQEATVLLTPSSSLLRSVYTHNCTCGYFMQNVMCSFPAFFPPPHQLSSSFLLNGLRSVLQVPVQVFPYSLTARTRVPGSLAGEVKHGLTIFTPGSQTKRSECEGNLERSLSSHLE